MIKQVNLLISGRVQGVFYRASAAENARSLKLVGFARNLPDGKVEIVAQGEEAYIARLVKWCHSVPPGAQVDDVAITVEEPQQNFVTFSVR